MTVVIELPILPAPVDELWHTLLDLGESLGVPWALIDGQMVLLHALEHGQVPPQISQDGDVIADIRAVPGALTRVVAGIENLGFSLQSTAQMASPTATSGPRNHVRSSSTSWHRKAWTPTGRPHGQADQF